MIADLFRVSDGYFASWATTSKQAQTHYIYGKYTHLTQHIDIGWR